MSESYRIQNIYNLHKQRACHGCSALRAFCQNFEPRQDRRLTQAEVQQTSALAAERAALFCRPREDTRKCQMEPEGQDYRAAAWIFNAIEFALLLNVVRVPILSSPLPSAVEPYSLLSSTSLTP